MPRLADLLQTLLLPAICLAMSCAADTDSREASADPSPTGSGGAAGAPADLRDGEDWPVFLGPQHNGVSTETGLLDEWPAAGPPAVWDLEVGAGYSAPSVRGARVVLHHRIGREEIVECFRAESGESLWKYGYPSDFRDPYGYNNGPRCTPLLTDSHCYTLGAEGKLLCLTLDAGEPVWMRDLKTDFDVPDGFFGVGATPILEGDRLIVAVGGQPNSGIVAFDPADGEPLWQNVGRSTWDGVETDSRLRPVYNWRGDEMVVSYSSPIAATIHGRRHVLCLMRHGLVSVDPQTGAENFHYWFRSRAYESVNAARPVVTGDEIMISAAYDVGAALLQVQPDGDAVDTVWRDEENLLTHWSTAIEVDGFYYGFSGRHDYEATLRCIDRSSGAVVWETSGSARDPAEFRRASSDEVLDTVSGEVVPMPYYGRGSAILADGRFIVLSEYGTLALLNVNPERWDEVSRFKVPQMHYPSWTAPVLSRGYLYLRCEDALVCLDVRDPNG